MSPRLFQRLWLLTAVVGIALAVFVTWILYFPWQLAWVVLAAGLLSSGLIALFRWAR
jgi:hypothetical protein